MSNTCGSCMCFDFNKSNGKSFFTKYWCTRFNCWRGADQGACDAFVGKGGACFLTTACVRYKGLADDCEELSTLRSFRDGYLQSREGGKALIDEYYKIAPSIVKKIDSLKDNNKKTEIYDFIYSQICICVDLIKSEQLESVIDTYVNMVNKVKEIIE